MNWFFCLISGVLHLIFTLRLLSSFCSTVNIEYNLLEPALKATKEFKDGDVNDETGYSPFPGNINQLVFQLDAYNKVLQRTQGVMPDFVNPKYKDASKTVFKKPTRLECMMQEFPTVLEADESQKVGFTQAAAEICFSPVKNAVAEGAALQAKGIAAATAATGEADQYAAQRIMLRARGCIIEDAKPVVYNGIKVVPGPAIVLKPDFACCPGELNIKFPTPEKVKISSRSTLVVRGPGVTIESMELDGCLVIDVDRGETAVVRDLVVKNDGWVQVPVKDSPDEVIAMRGFIIDRRDARYVEVQTKEDAPDDTSIKGNEEYEVEDSYCGVNFGASKRNDGGCSVM
jgi:UDP-sugar pyrophosphorylase